MRSRARCIAAMATGALLLAGCTQGDQGQGEDIEENGEYHPSGTVKMVVAMAPGGGSDRAMRVMSEAVNENAEGYNTVVENREGGGGAVGWSYFYGLDGEPGNLVKAESAINTLPLQEGVEVPWTYEDFTPIALFGEDSRMIVAPADSDLDTCADLASTTDLAIGNSGTYGADGMAIHHLEQAGMQANKVPYGSTGEVMTALLGDQIEAAPASAASAKPYVESGDLKALCTFSEERFDDDVLGNVETAEEQGIDGTVVLWRGVLAPPNISEAAQEFWIQEFQKATETDVYHEYIEDDLLIEKQLYGDEFAAYLDEHDAEIREYFQ